MEHNTFEITAYHTKIFGQIWKPKQPKGIVVLVHGMGEHSGRYVKNVVPMLLKTNVVVIGYDTIGHGKSGGKRGHCPSYIALLDILDAILSVGTERFPGYPLFLYGHSMGGNVVLNYVLRKKNKIRAIIATSPYLRLAFSPPLWKMKLGKLLLHTAPSLTLASGLNVQGISRDLDEVQRYIEDPLIHDKVSPMFTFPVMDAGIWVIENAAKLELPALLLHGTGDSIIDHKATLEFSENAPNSTLQLFDGGFHELHHDLCADEVLQTIHNWLQLQL